MTRINWFSPMPPAKTEIAQHSARILAALRQSLEVSVWAAQERVTAEVETIAPVHRYDPQSPPWRELNRADLNVYNIGNNGEFHAGIWQVSRQMPGITILHDERLQQLFANFFLNRVRDFSTYKREMSRIYGPSGSAAAADYLAGRCRIDQLVERFPLTQLAIENALGVVVHTRAVFDVVKKLTSAPALYAPLPYPAASSREEEQWKTIREATIRPPFRLVVFGYIGTNRRLEAILEALAGHPERSHFRLDIYGTVWDPDHVLKYAAQSGLASCVRLHGYVEDLDAVLAAADLALNLRYPTMGEASASQLRIWNHGLPSLVTRIGWYESLPPDAVAFVSPESEIEDIRNHLTRFLGNPKAFREIGERGRMLLKRDHNPSDYADAMALIVSRALRYRPYSEALALAEHMAEHIQFFQPENAREHLTKRVSEVIYSVSVADHREKARGQHA